MIRAVGKKSPLSIFYGVTLFSNLIHVEPIIYIQDIHFQDKIGKERRCNFCGGAWLGIKNSHKGGPNTKL